MMQQWSPPALLGGKLCLDYCNTVAYRDHAHPEDILAEGYLRLVWWAALLKLVEEREAARLVQFSAAEPAQARAAFDQAAALREALYQVFVAKVKHQAVPGEALALLNDTIQQAMAHRLLSVTPEGKVAWGWQGQDAPEAVLWPISLSAAELLVSDDFPRVKQCPGCGWLFFDESRNRSRTWCDMQYCGNRAKNRRFHQRRKADKA